MADLPRREWLANVGSGLALLSIGFGVATADRINAESSTGVLGYLQDSVESVTSDGSIRDETPNSSVQDATSECSVQDEQTLSYELDENGDVEFDAENISFEAESDSVEFVVDGKTSIDFEAAPDAVELTVLTDLDKVDFEYDSDGAIEFQATGADADTDFESENKEIDYDGNLVDFEWVENKEVQIDGDVRMEYRAGEFEWTGHELTFEWDRTDNDFEVERVSRRTPRSKT